MAPRTRFELVPTASKTVVLPLHYQGTLTLQIFKEQVCIVSEPEVLSTTVLFQNNKQKTLRTFVTKGLVFEILVYYSILTLSESSHLTLALYH